MKNPDTICTERIREEELHFFIDRARPKSRVLEIGAGSGYQASRIAAHGFLVDAIDINIQSETFFPVTQYDGLKLPFKDGEFDYVFSSNVLEHIIDLDRIEAEIGRVLKIDGTAIHILPTHMWRFWTTLTYYPAIPKIINAALEHVRQEGTTSIADRRTENAEIMIFPLSSRIRRYLKWFGTLCLSPRHGERGNRLSEFFYFHPSWWRAHFQDNDFEVIEEKKGDIYYSGNVLFGLSLDIPTRRQLAKVLGSSTVCFMLRRLHPK